MSYPISSGPLNEALVTGDAVTRIGQAAEAAGFHGMAFTDHPAPSHRWLHAGGHSALDPFAALAFVAATTSRLRLIPSVAVLPYRNPFVVAKLAATLDRLSDGRFTLSVATGYLRSEYKALGVDFEARNDLFDEALEVIRGVWATDEYSFEARDFSARGITALPQPGFIPIWIGGNSALSRRRVVASGDGWNPFLAPPVLAQTARTQPVQSLTDLLPLLDDLRRRATDAGRDPSTIDVQFGTGLPGPGTAAFSADAHLTALGDLAAAGITWTTVDLPDSSVEAALEALGLYGETVISRFDGGA